MPTYDFRCRACGDTFQVSRPMAASGEPASCPEGHDDTVKLLTVGAVATSAGRASAPSGGGCCGGGCCG